MTLWSIRLGTLEASKKIAPLKVAMVVQQVPAHPGVAVAEIDPDSRGGVAVVDVVALHHRVEEEQDLDARGLLVGLHLLPAAVVDVIAGHQAAGHDGPLDAAGAAIVHVIAPD